MPGGIPAEIRRVSRGASVACRVPVSPVSVAIETTSWSLRAVSALVSAIAVPVAVNETAISTVRTLFMLLCSSGCALGSGLALGWLAAFWAAGHRRFVADLGAVLARVP